MQLNLDDLIERQLDALAPSEAEFRQLINQAIPVFDAEPKRADPPGKNRRKRRKKINAPLAAHLLRK